MSCRGSCHLKSIEQQAKRGQEVPVREGVSVVLEQLLHRDQFFNRLGAQAHLLGHVVEKCAQKLTRGGNKAGRGLQRILL